MNLRHLDLIIKKTKFDTVAYVSTNSTYYEFMTKNAIRNC